MSKHLYTTAHLNDKQLKEHGNKLYSLRKYEEAIDFYTKAIMKNPAVASYYTNRALCYLKLKDYDTACKDCKYALEIDLSNVKAHFFLGQALLEMECYDEAINHLIRANDLAKNKAINFGDDITSQIRAAKKKRFFVHEEKRVTQEIELQSYLNRLIHEDMERRIKQEELDSTKKDDKEESISKIEKECAKYALELNDMFSKLDERRMKREVPDYLCGKISFEILTEPVITPCGITYDRKDIEEHLQRVGHFDPVTRTKLTADMLIPNFTVKEVVDAFLQENEWALYY